MSHDPLCPNIPCDCEPDFYGHDVNCRMTCRCGEYAQVRRAGRLEAAAHIRKYVEETHKPHASDFGCNRCDIAAALLVCANEIEADRLRHSGFVKCPSCGGKGEIAAFPFGEPDSCTGCRGTGEVPEYVFDVEEFEE